MDFEEERRGLLQAEAGHGEPGPGQGEQDAPLSEQELYLSKVQNGRLYLASFAAVLGPLSFGFVLGYSSPAIPDLTNIDDPRLRLDSDQASWFGSIVTIGAAVGGLLGDWMVQKLGSKLSLMASAVSFVCGFTVIVAAQSVWMLYLGWALAGLASGVTSPVVPGSCVQLTVVLGIMGVYLAGLVPDWWWLAVCSSVLPTLMLLSRVQRRWKSARIEAAAQEQLLDLPDAEHLKWLPFNGSLPDGAVKIFNDYTQRTDYVCKVNCEPGFYSATKGQLCFYPYAGIEHASAKFEVLVNENNFELLDWVEDSYGAAPPFAVRTHPDMNVFVGKNKYGLGKVVTQHEAFFLPWEGKEYWYKSYQVLTINRERYSQLLPRGVRHRRDGALPPSPGGAAAVPRHQPGVQQRVQDGAAGEDHRAGEALGHRARDEERLCQHHEGQSAHPRSWCRRTTRASCGWRGGR